MSNKNPNQKTFNNDDENEEKNLSTGQNIQQSNDDDPGKDIDDKNPGKDSDDKNSVKDSDDKDHGKDSDDKDHVKDSDDKNSVKDSDDKDHGKESDDKNSVKDSDDKNSVKDSDDKDHGKDSDDKNQGKEGSDNHGSDVIHTAGSSSSSASTKEAVTNNLLDNEDKDTLDFHTPDTNHHTNDANSIHTASISTESHLSAGLSGESLITDLITQNDPHHHQG